MVEIEELAREFEEQANGYDADLEPKKAHICRSHAQRLRQVLLDMKATLLDPSAAAAHSGYSKSQLRALVGMGRIKNYGKGRAPLYRKSDLPIRPLAREVQHSIEPSAAMQKAAEKILRRVG